MNLKKSDITRTLILAFAIAGLGIMGYLTYTHITGAQSFCELTETVSCDTVTTSVYSKIFGIPISILGFLYFGTILLLLFWNKKNTVFKTIFLLTLFALVPSLYLSLTELLFIKALCILCETSKVLMVGILGLSIYAGRPKLKITVNLVAPIIIAGVVSAGIMFLAQREPAPQQDLTSLVECINETGVVYYKSVQCSNCRRQEQRLGDAYWKLNSIECHPDGQDSNPKLCLEKEVSKTPTFILEKDDVELNRLVGLQSVENLAEFSGCNLNQES